MRKTEDGMLNEIMMSMIGIVVTYTVFHWTLPWYKRLWYFILDTWDKLWWWLKKVTNVRSYLSRL